MPADRRGRPSAVFIPSGTLTEAKGRGISTEVELKLVASAADLPELKRALVEMTPVSGSSQSRLISTYYDTPDLALKHRGLSLRVREQDGRFIQTVKEGDPDGGDLLTRGEWEDELAESRPDPHAAQSGAHLPDGSGYWQRIVMRWKNDTGSFPMVTACSLPDGRKRGAGPANKRQP